MMRGPNRDWTDGLLDLWWQRARGQWEVWALGADRDLSELDEELYLLCREHAAEIEEAPGRYGEVLRRRTNRVLADCDPEVATCRNWVDRAFFTEEGGKGQTPSGVMRERVLELMQLRDARARDLGFASYPELVFWDEELDWGRVERMVNDLVRSQEAERRAVMAEFGIKSLVVGKGAPNEYRSQLGRIHSRLVSEMYAPDAPDAVTASRRLLESLGLQEALDRIQIEVRPENGLELVLECGPEDIRLLLEHRFDCRFHELGHALGRSLNRGSGIYRLLPTATDEAFGQGFHQVASAVPETAEMFGITSEKALRATHYEGIFENARLGASFNFEMGLWRDRSDPEKLYRQCYADFGMEVADEEEWPQDTFRSIDPVYVHNYVLAHMFGEATLEHLRHEVSAEASPAWGQWLVASYYRNGAAESLMQKAQALGNRNPFGLCSS